VPEPLLIARNPDPGSSLPIVFLESRKPAEEWTYRFLAAAASELSQP